MPCPIMPIIMGLPPPPKKLGFYERTEREVSVSW